MVKQKPKCERRLCGGLMCTIQYPCANHSHVSSSSSFYPFVPTWNKGPSWNPSIWTHLRLVLMPLSNFSQPYAVPIPFFFVCPSSLYPEGSSPMCVFLLNFVVSTVYGQSSATVFPVFLVQFIVYLYTESFLTQLFAVVELWPMVMLPHPAGILTQDQCSNLPVVL